MRTLKDGATPTELHTLKGYTDCVKALKFSPDDQKIASCSDEGTVLLAVCNQASGCSRVGGMWGLVWSPDSKLVACA